MKRIISTLLAIMLMLTLNIGVVAQESGAVFTPGTYTATVNSIGGPLTVSVTLTQSAIEGIEVLECNDTDGVADVPLARIPAEILRTQNLNVDTVSGATMTSILLRNAIGQAVASGCNDPDALPKESAPYAAAAQTDMQADVVVVGGGIAGLTAALASAGNGLETVLLEKNGYVGGTALISEGAILGTYTEPIASNFDYACQMLLSHGIDVHPAQFYGYEDYDYRSLDAREGRSVMATLIDQLSEAAQAAGVTILTDTPCIGLLDNSGAVAGVSAQPKGQETFQIASPSVILCTGGFASNKDLVAKYLPAYAGMRASSLPGATGDALAWIEAFDGQTIMLDSDFQGYCVNPMTGYRASSGCTYPLYVDKTGNRFSESAYYTDVVHAAWQQFGSDTFYAIMDDATVELFEYRDTMNHMLTANAAVRYDSISAIAEAYNLPDLEKTMTDNGFAEEGIYYVSPAVATIYSTYGGIAVDEKARVLNNAGSTVPGLYAAGEVIGSPNFQQLGSYFGQLAPGMIMGTIAADAIAEANS